MRMTIPFSYTHVFLSLAVAKSGKTITLMHAYFKHAEIVKEQKEKREEDENNNNISV